MASIDMLQKRHSYHKYHLKKMAPNINSTSQKWHFTKRFGAKCESYRKCKKSLLKITVRSPWQITSGHFFARWTNFVRHHFSWVLYLSISGGVFVMCHFCKMPLFSNSINKVCLSCKMSFLLAGLLKGLFPRVTALPAVRRETSNKT